MTWAEFEQDFFANIWNSFSKTWNPGIIFLAVYAKDKLDSSKNDI